MNQKPTPSAHKTNLWLAAFLWATMLFTALPGRAQFTGDYQTNIISGTAMNWPSNYYVGSNYAFNSLSILNGGFLSNEWGLIGYQSSGNSNLAVVSGNGSAWTNLGSFYVGYYGAANRLVISDGGRVQVFGLNTVVGSEANSISNSVLVTGSGSVWNTHFSGLFMGDGGSHCSIVISNGGAVFADKGLVGGNYGGQTNIAIVTGSGSVWSNRTTMSVGDHGNGNTLVVSNGGAVFGTDGRIGHTRRAQNNSVLITDSGSLWNSSGTLYVGYGILPTISSRIATNNRLTIANGGSVLASNVYVSFFEHASNNLIHISGGNLTVTNLSGTGILDVRRGALTFNSGTITADKLWLTNGPNSILEFNSGAFHSKATVISNTQPCVVGDGVASANFHLLGGVHSFKDGLRIRASGLLSGCGTVNGNLLVDVGGAVVADCSALMFNGNVTNNGVLIAKNGSVLQSAGTVVNNGTIYLLNGGTTNFSGTFINNGTIHYSFSPQISGMSVVGGDVMVQVASIPTLNYFLQTSATLQPLAWTNSGAAQSGTGGLLLFTEPGSATIGTKRFYRVGAQ